MIITRSPLRICLGGGGTDLPSYYREYGGFVLAAAIDKYVYITLHHTFGQEFILKYSRMERVDNINDIEHPLFREALRITGTDCKNLEITSMADIPAGTGLGSSGAFIVALLKALHLHHKNLIHPQELAEQACKIEIDILKEPVGKQDQYISAFGGITCFRFHSDQRVEAWPLRMDQDVLYTLEDNLLLFFTGYSRSASEILRQQDSKSIDRDPSMIENLDFIKQIGEESREALESADLAKFARLMNVHWEHKKKRSPYMSNDRINECYELGMRNGALGGKLIGAGGGGFLMFYAEDRVRLRQAMKLARLEEVRFRFDFEGTKVVGLS
jgi:D-glycero-alpha-D-manno-heptose-7-phosphate kinase